MKALIAMSGGVDSSVAAKLTVDLGYECIGCTMKLYDNADAGVSQESTCCSLDDIEDARSVCCRLGMPHYVFNFSQDFGAKIIDKFVCSYLSGITPNPCIDCNRYMKFEALMDRACELGCEKVVTGHYARIEEENGVYLLKKAADETKDQSYVLYSLDQDRLSHTLFPLGSLHKSETRKIAEECGFLNASKPDSQDICFVPDGDYAAVIERRTGKTAEPGDFVDKNGKVLGRHTGIIHYTIGQHRGFGLFQSNRLYVCGIDPKANTVHLGSLEELFSSEADVKDFNWVSGEVPAQPIHCKAKIRYRHTEQPVTVTPTGKDTVHLSFDEPQRAITPGQAAVLYDGDLVLGGGILCRKDEV